MINPNTMTPQDALTALKLLNALTTLNPKQQHLFDSSLMTLQMLVRYHEEEYDKLINYDNTI